MRWHVAGLLAAVIGVSAAHAQTPAPPTVDPALDAYIKPDRLAKLPDGRRIHLYCRGKGSPTVILTAGLGGWSTSWVKVHPAIATRTRTCAWDRAGFGHSDSSPAPQTLVATTGDLEGALAAARIRGPYVLVGHSAGAFESLLFADRHRRDVVGMVLVDGSVPDQLARFERAAPALAAGNAATMAIQVGGQRTCAKNLESGGLKPDTPAWKLCFGYGPALSPRMVAAMPATGAHLLTRASLAEEFGRSAAAAANPSRDYGDLPLVVLTQSSSPTPPGAKAEDAAALRAGWVAWHDDYAKLSTRGVNLIVQGAGHGIQSDKPQAVIGAVDAVLNAARR
jgi:pimeloyl-ACP methyl ester carboxylesterase